MKIKPNILCYILYVDSGYGTAWEYERKEVWRREPRKGDMERYELNTVQAREYQKGTHYFACLQKVIKNIF